jgi:hypothetical protein
MACDVCCQHLPILLICKQLLQIAKRKKMTKTAGTRGSIPGEPQAVIDDVLLPKNVVRDLFLL